MGAFEQMDDLDPVAESILKEQKAADRNKRQIEKTEQYLEANYTFRRNLVSIDIEYKHKESKGPYLSFDDVAINNLWREFQHKGVPYSKQKAVDLIKSDFSPKYDPFVEYFTSLSPYHPKEGDHIKKLLSYITVNTKTGKQEDFEKHFTKHLIRTVRCAIDQDYFNKHAFILVQEKQHAGKSTFLRYLCPPALQRYYTEELTVDKDGLITLCENFIINMDELAVMNKAEINHLKTLISKLWVKVRPPFEKKAQATSRRASFVGSTNDRQFLTDSTGSVRWICFEIEEINFDYTCVDINRIWAQAYWMLNQGVEHNITKEEVIDNEARNFEFKVTSVEKEMLIKYFEPAQREDLNNELGEVKFMTSVDFINFIGKVTGTNTKISPIQIGKALNELGFERSQKFQGKFQVKGYWVREYFTKQQ